ncbi:unnamed protein product, partial [Iphiclides podalirius]
MADLQAAHKEVLDEIVNRKKLGDKKSHSETSLQNLDENEEGNFSDISKDPGVLNMSVNGGTHHDDNGERRRTMSQPGPVSGSLLTATASRAARRRPPRNVMYAPNLEINGQFSSMLPGGLFVRRVTLAHRTVNLLSPAGREPPWPLPIAHSHPPFPAHPVNTDSGPCRPNASPNENPISLFLYSRTRTVNPPHNYRIYTTMNDMRGGTTPRKRSVATMDAQSLRSVETHAPPPTNPEDNKRLTTDFLEMGYLLNDCTKLGLHVVMLFAVVVAYNQTIKLDINEHPISLLDDVLLFICLPAFFMETVFSMTATISILNVIKTVDVSVMVIQVIIQTALLVDGLRRCSNSRKLRRTKPGRELLMFLIISNVGMWLLNTFSYKSPESLDERYEFYGKVLWSILGHISLPLIMFYRFHSSVCFADIWGSAYKPGSEH